MNPVFIDVPSAFARVATQPRSVTIDRKGVVLPKGGHFQGIQPLGARSERLVITSSSDSQAYFVICDMNADGTRGRANAPVRLAGSPLNHAGGCQTVETFLVVGVEDDDSKRKSEVQFWNLAGSPAQIAPLTIRRSGPEKVSTAGAVGISSVRNGGSILAVATWNAETIDFFVTTADPFHSSSAKFVFLRTWSNAAANKTGWIDRNFGEYQSINLLTQRDGKVFLVGFNRSGSDDWMDLFAVDVDAPPPMMLKKLAKKHMFCTAGCTFRHGAGIYSASPTSFEVYAVNGDSGDHATGTTIHVNHFPSA
jgi:hypothetical protein